MKHLGKLAVLGAVLVAYGPSASATTFSGFLTVQDAPAGDLGSFDSVVFTLSSVQMGASLGVPEPNTPSGSPNLTSYITNPTLFVFSTTGITASPTTGVELYSGTNVAGTESASFYGTSYDALDEDTNGDYGLTVYGYFTDNAGNHTAAYDNITFDSGVVNNKADTSNGSISEIFTAIPPPATPEPNSLILLGSGLLGASGLIMRRFRVNGRTA